MSPNRTGGAECRRPAGIRGPLPPLGRGGEGAGGRGRGGAIAGVRGGRLERPGPYFRFAGDKAWYGGDSTDSPEAVYAFAVDVRRRNLVREMAERLGHPPEVVELAWYLLPYRSVQLRAGWDAWSERRSGRDSERASDRFAERVRFNYS